MDRKQFIVGHDGRIQGVLLSLSTYEELLEKLEDWKDLREIKSMKKKKLRFKPIEAYLQKTR